MDLSLIHMCRFRRRVWFGGNNIDQPLGNRNLQLNSYPLVIDAACAGHGVALGWGHLVDDLIATNQLVRPIKQSLKTDLGYYCICRENLENDVNVVRFRNWLVQQTGASIDH